jgi:hypothetical protein
MAECEAAAAAAAASSEKLTLPKKTFPTSLKK